MALYNLTQLQASETFADLLVYANVSSNEVLINFMMVAVFLIVLMVLRRYDFIDVLLADSFGCMIISGFLAYGGFINIIVPLAFLMILVLSGFYVYMTRHD